MKTCEGTNERFERKNAVVMIAEGIISTVERKGLEAAVRDVLVGLLPHHGRRLPSHALSPGGRYARGGEASKAAG